ncbi:MAG: hypothetical protein R3E96_17255 [Planctomycetota bacterium]
MHADNGGLPAAGDVYLYELAAGNYIARLGEVVPFSQQLGYSLATDGGNLIIGAPQLQPGGVAYVFPGSTIGTRYCSPAVPNTTGESGRMRVEGSRYLAIGQLDMHAMRLPEGEFGYFLASRTQGLVTAPGGSQGNLCLSGAIARFNRPGEIFLVSAGQARVEVDMNDMPVPPSWGVPILAGETGNFQCWHRDFLPGIGSTSNFTDAVSVNFE